MNLSHSSRSNATLFTQIKDLITCAPLAKSNKISNINFEDLGRIQNAWLFVKDKKVHSFGSGNPPSSLTDHTEYSTVSCKNQLILPGLIDSHTHMLFAGQRHNEFAMRVNGKSYEEIAKAGGGIRSTVIKTREESSEDLAQLVRKRINQLLKYGVTSLEVKSGYGLSVAEEFRHLQILQEVKKTSSQQLVLTCLALHALPLEDISKSQYIQNICEELVPKLQTLEGVSYVDAFIEAGYFSAEDCTPFFKAAKKNGLGIRVHADEFSNGQGALTAAQWGAASADHLQFASDEGIDAMAKAGVIATILPGTSLYTAIPFTNGNRFTKASCPVAIASDFNPGSCSIDNLPLLATVAALHCKLNLAEVMAAITYVPAYSLGINRFKGSLHPGWDADFLIHPAESLEEWIADFGKTLPNQVWQQGRRVV